MFLDGKATYLAQFPKNAKNRGSPFNFKWTSFSAIFWWKGKRVSHDISVVFSPKCTGIVDNPQFKQNTKEGHTHQCQPKWKISEMKFKQKNMDEVPRPNQSLTNTKPRQNTNSNLIIKDLKWKINYWNIKAEIINLTSYLINGCSHQRSLTEWAKKKGNWYVTFIQEMDLACKPLKNHSHTYKQV